ncbi:hypothetical protein JKP88DRAFT_253572 [Tribonema minus]|uniref:Uncharacterized protein n=1 Tax=Tribonema minus TaxID=303371 RepID=A0A835Z9B2_9STRA|nr:hypothetical protein JKP88DRAFT_253572 [Tribonema minus]
MAAEAQHGWQQARAPAACGATCCADNLGCRHKEANCKGAVAAARCVAGAECCFNGAERCHIRVNQAVERKGIELRGDAEFVMMGFMKAPAACTCESVPRWLAAAVVAAAALVWWWSEESQMSVMLDSSSGYNRTMAAATVAAAPVATGYILLMMRGQCHGRNAGIDFMDQTVLSHESDTVGV